MSNPTKPRIIIEISGGLVFNVMTDRPASVFLIDWDNLEHGVGKGTLQETLSMCDSGDTPDAVIDGLEFDGYLLNLKLEIQRLIDKLPKEVSKGKEK